MPGVEHGEASATLVAATLTHRVRSLLLPAWSSPIYPLLRDDAPSTMTLLIGPALIALAVLWALRARNGTDAERRVASGVLAAAVLAIPTCGISPPTLQLADRDGVLPLLGVAIALGHTLGGVVAAQQRTASIAAALVLAALAGRTVQYELEWASAPRLFGHAVSTYPRSYYGWIGLGHARVETGDVEGALRAFESAIELSPNIRAGHAGFLECLALRDERYREVTTPAAHAHAMTFTYAMDDSMALRDLAMAMAEDGYRDAATYVLARALDIDPVSDERLEQAAATQIGRHHEWLALFYVSRMQRRPVLPSVAALVERERERLGIARDDEDDEPRPPPP